MFKMPSKKVPKKVPCVPCAVCQLAIVDGKDEALLCEANCQLWYHRGCASIPPARYRELSTSDEPFVCLSCTVLDQRREIAELHSTVTALREELHKMTNMQESKMTAISAEVTKLKQALSDRKQSEPLKPSSRRTPATRVPRPSKRTYAAAAGFVANNPSTSTAKATTATDDGSQAATASDRKTDAKVKVVGARRIWGTLKTCSPGAVSTTISKLVPTTGALRVKRKTKRLANKSVWWFVVHCSESDLTLLEKSWGKIQSQTLWTLQECFMPAASKPASVSVDANSQHKPDAGETEQPVPESDPVTAVIDVQETSESMLLLLHNCPKLPHVHLPNKIRF